ncbi:GNAT family N-acetyltransferase [Janibacter melonis]|uniref:GNAT family N-acetyltransferase n=1 Tax=Janibacter melonis TaxID=262209 RepID=UPI001E3DD516|nr:GNAT family N-acetyltransferase [Janibacter melonis]MCB5990303.1 GNAT family N-acetyltransferase [Janibacter melonis]
MSHDVRPATPVDLPEAALTLVRAFEHYPWTRWSIPADDHLARLEELQLLYLAHALRHGVVLVDDEVHGVGAFLPPGAPDPDDATQGRVVELMDDRLPVVMSADLPPRPAGAWDLATLGVRPGSAGRGLGSAVLAEGLRRVDGMMSSVALETSDARNVRLYERHGFVVTGSTEIPDGPVVWSMCREATSPAGTGTGSGPTTG